MLVEMEQLVAQLETHEGLTPAVEEQLTAAGRPLLSTLQQLVAQLPTLSPAGRRFYTLVKPLFQQLLPVVNQWQNQGVQGNSWLAYQVAGEWEEVFALRGLERVIQTRPEMTHFMLGFQVQRRPGEPAQKGEVWVGLAEIRVYIQEKLVWTRPVDDVSAAGEIVVEIISQFAPFFEQPL
jgi:hypothetical protein